MLRHLIYFRSKSNDNSNCQRAYQLKNQNKLTREWERGMKEMMRMRVRGGELKTKYRTLQRFDFLPSLFHFNRSRELSQRQHMHKLCAQIKKSKHCSRLVTSSPRPAQLLLGTLTGMFTQTHPATHFKTIKQTFFFLAPLDLQKAQLLFKSRRCMNSEKRKNLNKNNL